MGSLMDSEGNTLVPLELKIRLTQGSSHKLFERFYSNHFCGRDDYQAASPRLYKLTGTINNRETDSGSTVHLTQSCVLLHAVSDARKHVNTTGDLSMYPATDWIEYEGAQTAQGKIEGTWKLNSSLDLSDPTVQDELKRMGLQGGTFGGFKLVKVVRQHGMSPRSPHTERGS